MLVLVFLWCEFVLVDVFVLNLMLSLMSHCRIDPEGKSWAIGTLECCGCHALSRASGCPLSFPFVLFVGSTMYVLGSGVSGVCHMHAEDDRWLTLCVESRARRIGWPCEADKCA